MSKYKIRLAGVGAACLLAIVAPACSSDGKSSSTTTPAGGTAGGAGVTIKNRQYSQSGDLKSNTAFTVTNSDGVTHTLTDDGGTFRVEISGNGTAPLTITKPGTYQVHCEIHSSMHGTITVT